MQCVCSSESCPRDERVELTTREYGVCSAVCESSEPVSFTQVREKTKLHQEIVSRTIRRLMIHGLVVKVGDRYKGVCADCCD